MAITTNIETVTVRVLSESTQENVTYETKLVDLALNTEARKSVFQQINNELRSLGLQSLPHPLQQTLTILFLEGTVADFLAGVVAYVASSPPGAINSPGVGGVYRCPQGDFTWRPVAKGVPPPLCPTHHMELIPG